jgi:ribosomal-protein-alanine N-acetyltransferase
MMNLLRMLADKILPKRAKMKVEKRQLAFRYYVRRDLPDILAIEEESFPYPWDTRDFTNNLRRRNVWAIVCEDISTGRIIGYTIYELHKHFIYVLSLAVHKEFRHQRIGRALLKKIKNKLRLGRRVAIEMHVADYNVPMHLFLREKAGFVATGVDRNFYDEEDVDAYSFRYELDSAPEVTFELEVTQHETT